MKAPTIAFVLSSPLQPVQDLDRRVLRLLHCSSATSGEGSYTPTPVVLPLACYTQSEIGNIVGLTQKQVSSILSNLSNFTEITLRTRMKSQLMRLPIVASGLECTADGYGPYFSHSSHTIHRGRWVCHILHS